MLKLEQFLSDDLFELIEEHEVYIKTLGANGKRLNVEHAVIENFDFSGCNLSHATFANSTIKGCNFSKIKISETVFLNCDFSGTDFFQSKLDGVIFENCIFEKDTNFADSIIRQTKFHNTNALLTFFVNVNFEFVIFSNCNLLKTLFNNSIFTSSKFEKTNFLCCEFPFCDVRKTAFLETFLSGCEMQSSKFNDCNFSMSNLADYYDYSFPSFSPNINDKFIPSGLDMVEIVSSSFDRCLGFEAFEKIVKTEERSKDMPYLDKVPLFKMLKYLENAIACFIGFFIVAIFLTIFAFFADRLFINRPEYVAFFYSVVIFVLSTIVPPVIYHIHLKILTILSKSSVNHFCDVKSHILSSIYDISTNKKSGKLILFILFFLPFLCILLWMFNLRFKNTDLSLINIGFVFYSFASAQYFLTKMIMAVKRFLDN